ncbi:N-acetylmuramoyl-L-alanine amidase CwlD [Paenibacillus pinistramenti]|uniref:N-acetylmuramoyl-L-alanine amidase CwlD n=1 Tax=Paenibacillus pinistramenti TaxID=1768003 RepID=UPI001108025F|nr:N-acetylmuramoyl-L-alanine amidase CwlD [Paenibacillus pinistramenti]
MKQRKTVTLWISVSNVKRILFMAVLLTLLAGILFYEVPVKRVSNYWSLPLAGKVIALDPGHGGPDGGASSKDGTIEKEINLSVALYLRDYLQQAGAIVYMTREDDKDLADTDTSGYSKRKTEDLKKRVRLIEEKEAKLMVSIHMNSIPSNKWRGAQTFYHPSHPESKVFADLVQEELRTNLENTDRIAKSADYVYLLKELKIPSVLVEVGFLSNPDESKLLGDEDYQRKVAASIYKGILRYEAGEKAKPTT